MANDYENDRAKVDYSKNASSQASEPRWGKVTPSVDERRFLQGPHGKLKELWDVFKIMFEFIRAFRTFHWIGPCVTVYGSARFADDHQYSVIARELGAALAEAGFTVMTGGGPGIMAAANRGAKDAGGYSVGCNVILPREQAPNKFLDLWMEFDWFFVRKMTLRKYSTAFVALPGGFGTLDEIFEVATLIQTRKMGNFPMILMGTDYWKPLIDFLQGRMVTHQTILQDDLERFILTDSVHEAVAIIEESDKRDKRQDRRKRRLSRNLKSSQKPNDTVATYTS